MLPVQYINMNTQGQCTIFLNYETYSDICVTCVKYSSLETLMRLLSDEIFFYIIIFIIISHNTLIL